MARGPWHSIALLALLLGVLAFASAAHGAGELDSTFDGDGKVLTDFGGSDIVRGTAMQADGKIVAAGGGGAPNPDFALARYNPDGSLDQSFDGDGRVLTDFFAGGDQALGVAIQADGKIVAAGESSAGATPRDLALARYHPDGSLDQSFDGDGRVLTDFFAGFDQALGVAIQGDGKIVAAGRGGPSRDFALARYNPDGSLDPSFDADGRVVTDFGAVDGAYDAEIQADGKILTTGSTESGDASPDNFALARYNPDGSLDPSFGADGRVVTDFSARSDFAYDAEIHADGKIVAVGESGVGTVANPFDFALARYHPDGSLDQSFDGDGRVVTDFGAEDFARGVAIQNDGKIVAAGEADFDDFGLARYNPDGSLDPSFGVSDDGRVFTDFGGRDFAEEIAIQADGKLLAAGGSGGRDFALARYLADANLPPDCSTVKVTPNTLRPPNRRLRLVTLTGATDRDGDTVTLTVTGVSQDEPLNGRGDGNTSPDARAGTQSSNVFLRAERSGSGDGRVYRVSFTGSDGEGGSCSGTATVGVPRNAGSTSVDSAPPSLDSFGG